jgi:glycerol-3-phosphate dehydrogenase (NAD(P)+)
MSKVAVFGAGSWGTAFSVVLADAGNDVTLWARREELCATINEKRQNTDYLPGVELPAAVDATHDPERTLAGAEFVVLAVPSQTLRENLVGWSDWIPSDAVLVSLMKGVELGTPEADERGDQRGHRCRRRPGGRRQRTQPGQGDRPTRAGRERGRMR